MLQWLRHATGECMYGNSSFVKLACKYLGFDMQYEDDTFIFKLRFCKIISTILFLEFLIPNLKYMFTNCGFLIK